MLKWLFKKLGYIHESELEHYHCNCCNLRPTPIAQYYDKEMLKNLGNTIVYHRLLTKEVKRGRKLKTQRRTVR